MQIQSLTWQTLLLQLLLSLGPAAIAVAATYLTMRYQRKLKADELSSASSLRARELIFGIYEKRLASLLEQSDALADAVARVQVALESKQDKEKVVDALSKFFASVYRAALLIPNQVEELEGELSAAGLTERFAEGINFIKGNMGAGFLSTAQPVTSLEGQQTAILNMLRTTTYMIQMQRGMMEVKADELFRDFLPTANVRLVKDRHNA